MKNIILIACLLSLPAFATKAELPKPATKANVTYQTDIKPILDASCIKCHTANDKPKARLGLDSLSAIQRGSKGGPVILAGNSAKSKLVLTVAHVGDPDSFMPRGKDAKALTADQIGLIRAWIDQGGH